MKKPTPVYYEKYSETAAKLIDDYTAEQCLYYIQKYCMTRDYCTNCKFMTEYGKCEFSRNVKSPIEWRL